MPFIPKLRQSLQLTSPIIKVPEYGKTTFFFYQIWLVDDTEGTGQRISFGLAKLMRDLLRLILDIFVMKLCPLCPLFSILSYLSKDHTGFFKTPFLWWSIYNPQNVPFNVNQNGYANFICRKRSFKFC